MSKFGREQTTPKVMKLWNQSSRMSQGPGKPKNAILVTGTYPLAGVKQLATPETRLLHKQFVIILLLSLSLSLVPSLVAFLRFIYLLKLLRNIHVIHLIPRFSVLEFK